MTIKRSAGWGKGPLLLLMDAGATRTRAVVATPEGAVLGQGVTGPSNAYAVGDQLAEVNVVGAARRAIASATVSCRTITVAVVGSATVDNDGAGCAPIETALRSHLPTASIRPVGDSRIALEGALLGAPGVVIVSGTGSVVFGKSARGRFVQVGGWGPLLGDDGSAQWIGRQALQAVARAFDRTGPSTSLTRTVLRYFRLTSFERIIDVVYARPLSPAELGALAPLVARAARHDDSVAVGIFRRAARALAAQAGQAVHRLKLARPQVSYQGSMFRVGPTVLTPLRTALRKEAPQAALVAPALPPLGGAFLLALETLGLAATEPAISRFKENCHV